MAEFREGPSVQKFVGKGEPRSFRDLPVMAPNEPKYTDAEVETLLGLKPGDPGTEKIYHPPEDLSREALAKARGQNPENPVALAQDATLADELISSMFAAWDIRVDRSGKEPVLHHAEDHFRFAPTRKPPYRVTEYHIEWDDKYREIIAVRDRKDRFLGSAIVPNNSAEPIVVKPHLEVLTEAGIRFFQPVTEDDISRYIRNRHAYFGEDGIIGKHCRFDAMSEFIPLEYTVPIMKEYHEHPEYRKDIVGFVERYQSRSFSVLSAVASERQLTNLMTLARSTDRRDMTFLDTLVRGFDTYDMDAGSVAYDRSEEVRDPLRKKLRRNGYRMVQALLEGDVSDPETRSQVLLSLDASSDLLDGLFNLSGSSEEKLVMDAKMDGSVRKWVTTALTRDRKILDRISNMFELQFWKDLRAYIPGEYAKKAEAFYSALDTELTDIADTSTGFTEREIERYERLCEAAFSEGHIFPGFGMLDIGSGNGLRLLRPTLDNLERMGCKPGNVVAADMLPQKDNPRWKNVQCDFTDESFVKKVLDANGGKPFELVTSMWSPTSDVDPYDLPVVLDHLARVTSETGLIVLDIPAGYPAEKEIHARQHPDEPYGVIEKPFMRPSDRAVLSKPFHVPDPSKYVMRAMTGNIPLRWVNAPGGKEIPGMPTYYVNAQGAERATLVFVKGGVVDRSVDWILRRERISS